MVLALFTKRVPQILAVAAALLTLYTEGATAWINTQEAIKAKAAADNTAIRQKAEAELAEQKANTELETARNAAERIKGEADKPRPKKPRAKPSLPRVRRVMPDLKPTPMRKRSRPRRS